MNTKLHFAGIMVPLQIFGCLFVLIIVASSIRQGYGYSEEINAQEINEFVHFSIVKTEILFYNVTKITIFYFKK